MDDELRSRCNSEKCHYGLRADGSDGVMIQQPLLMAQDTGQVMLDWRGNGWLGQSFGFDASNPHQGRLGPNADVGATVTLPSGSEITDFILEVLAPADPFTSFEPVDLFIQDHEIHPVDGRMYIAIGTYIIILDAQSNPSAIDLFEIQNTADDLCTVEMDVANNRMLLQLQQAAYQLIWMTEVGTLIFSLDPQGAWSESPSPIAVNYSHWRVWYFHTQYRRWDELWNKRVQPVNGLEPTLENVQRQWNHVCFVLDGEVFRWDVASMSFLSVR